MWHKPINKRFFIHLWSKVAKDIREGKKRGVVLVSAFVIITILLGLNAGLMWLLFLAFAFYDWDNRVIGVAALFALTSCPFLLQLKMDEWAETMAVYAYFFIVMTVVLQIIEYKRYPEQFKDNDKK